MGSFTVPADTGITRVVKSADETVNNSDVLQNDDELLLPVLANTAYYFILALRCNSSGVADIKGCFTAPAGATCEYQGVSLNHASSVTVDWVISPNVFTCYGAGANYGMSVFGILTTAAAAGNLTFQWAQRVAEVSNTKVLANSMLILFKAS